MLIRFVHIFLGVYFSCSVAIAGQTQLSSAEASHKALENNPNLAMINARFLALSKISVQVGALPEPTFRFNFANLPLDSFAFDQTPMTQIQIGITQALPFPGKLALKSETASILATASQENWQDAKRKLIQQVKHHWWQLFYLDHALLIIEKNFDVLNQLIEVTETKYSVGQGLQHDILLAQVESSRLQDKKLQTLAKRRTTQAKLNNLMGVSQNNKITLPINIDVNLPTINNSADYHTQAKLNRPDVKRIKLLADAAKKRIELAKRDHYPNFQLGALYGWRENQTGLASLQLSMNIPWDTTNRQKPAIDQRNNEWMQQKYAVNVVENQIKEDIEIAVSNYSQANQQANLYINTIIPQTEQAVQAMLAGYQVNKVDFLNLMQAQITLLNYETLYWKSLSQAKQSLAALDAAIGATLIGTTLGVKHE